MSTVTAITPDAINAARPPLLQRASANRWRRPRQGVAVAAAGLAVVLPAITGRYVVTLAATAIILALLAMSTQLLAVAALPSFGQTAFLAVGAYTAAHLADAGLTDGLLQLSGATLAAALAGAAVAPVVLRTRGTTFLMVTIMIQGLAAAVALHWTSVTGGDEGVDTPPVTLWPGHPLTEAAYQYWYALAVLAACGAGIGWLMRSRLVLVLRGHAGHEPRMAALGHHPTIGLGLGYTAAAAIAGAGGALLIVVNQHAGPADLGFGTAAAGFAAAALGTCLTGTPTMTGALTAAIAIIALRDATGSNGTGPLYLGLLCLTVPYLRPTVLRLHRHWARRSEPTA
ncbi:branched-chain amino acid ABC transporter permease [Winogradskya humida]|uniref:Amino acid/amide ABC transporter membrane protein 2 (HAAT family) n=1 Tax=Winogradskya humida TaxID=113566 RepID=A0ABQ4A1S0_9ACTN|nr:branched-chain amino acid ABC transporter permease [Actinoplanes humidus]GIE24791.1 hypothetical protein Ahu01nite_078930 [Actinoplanes humidus]